MRSLFNLRGEIAVAWSVRAKELALIEEACAAPSGGGAHRCLNGVVPTETRNRRAVCRLPCLFAFSVAATRPTHVVRIDAYRRVRHASALRTQVRRTRGASPHAHCWMRALTNLDACSHRNVGAGKAPHDDAFSLCHKTATF